MNTRENIHYQPGGGNVPESYEEDLDWDADAKVNTLDNLDYEPGGGCVKIFSERLHWKAEPKVDTGLQRKSDKIQNDNIPVKSDLQRYDSSKQQVSITIEPVPERFNHSYLEPVPEVEYQSAADIKRDQTQIEPLRSQVVDSKVIKDPDIDQTDGVLDNTDTAKVIQQDWNQGPPPPPKPPRCIHEDWGHEKVDTSKSDEKEILTFTEEELEEILRKRDFVESQEDTNVSDNQSKQVEEQETEIKDDRNNFHIPINDITNENEMEMESVDHKEDTVVLERMVIEKCDGKENVDISLNKSKKKSGFVNKMRCLFSNSKKKQAKENDKENRFSSTSYNINRSNSNRISVKGKKLKEFANEEQKEVELMVKYLGYHSPILSKKGKIIKENDKESKKESCKNVLKKKHMEKGEPIEKLANLGYKSPKLAKKGGKPTIMTGSPTLKRKSGFGNKEMNVETMECITDENDRLDLLCCENVQMISVNEGVVSDYQDIDFGANVADIKNGKCVDGLTIFNETKYVKMQEKSPVNGFVNEGYEYDDVASDEDTESPNEDDDTDESIEEERHTSVAEFTVNSNRKSQKGIQTTTFKYKMDKRPTSPLNIIKHEKVAETCLSIEERTDVEKGVDQVFIAKKESAPTHDKFGYALVHKLENMKVSDDKNETENVLERNANNPENNRNRLGERNNFEKDVLDDIENKVMHKTVTKCERKSNLDQEEIEHELTLDEELRAVLANMHDNESSLLKTPRRHEGTETGSRPGTPKISVKPIWMQAEEERKGNGFREKYGMRRYLSDDNLSKNTQPLFGRSNRTQSMTVRGGAVNMRSGNILRGSDRESARNLARYTKLIDLKSAPVDDVKKSPMEITSENERSLLSTKPTSGREMTGDFVSGLYDDAGNGSLEISKNNESLKFDSFERYRTSSGLCPGVFEGDSLGESVRTLNTISNTRGHSGHSNTHEDTVVSQKLSWSAKSRVGSLENATHSPGGGNVKVVSQRLSWSANARVGSLDNAHYRSGGGRVKVYEI